MRELSGKSTNDERAQRILDAAAELISHYGYDKTTVSDIASAAGVSKGAIYLHWDGKESLFEALLQRELGRYADDWLALFEADDTVWNFVGMFKIMLITLQKHPFMLALFKRDQRVLGSFLRQDSSLLRQKSLANTELYRLMQQAGAARDDIEPQVIAYLLNMFAFGLISAPEVIPAEDAPSFEVIIDGMGKVLDRGLAPDGPGNPQAARALIVQIVEALRAQQRAQHVQE
jgi:TetR/AcrR family acrAB operon transcriptional repressor